MAQDDEPAPLTEPVIAQDVFATGINVEGIDGEIRLVAWVDVSSDGAERRIVNRLVMPDAVARGLARDLRKLLARGGH